MTVQVGVRLVAAARRRRSPGIVGVVGVAGTRRRVSVIDRRPADARRRASITVTRVVVIARRRTTAVVVTTRAVAAGRTTTVVIVVRRTIAAASSTGGRAGPVALTRTLLLDLVVVRIRTVVEVVGLLRLSDISNASDRLSLKFAVVELLDGVAEIVGSLVLNESGFWSESFGFVKGSVSGDTHPRPSRSRPTSE